MSAFMLNLIALWTTLAGLYLVLAGTVSLTEAVCAAFCASLGVVWAWRACSHGTLRFGFSRSTLATVGASVAAVPAQLAEVGRRLVGCVLGRKTTGSTRTRPLHDLATSPVPADARQAAGWRAVGVIAASLAPASFILRLEPGHDRLLEHGFETGQREAS
jgi:hypothetical protein